MKHVRPILVRALLHIKDSFQDSKEKVYITGDLHIYALRDHVASSSRYVASSCSMISELENTWSKPSWPEVLSWPEDLRNVTKYLSQDSRSQVQGLNPGNPDYEALLLSFQCNITITIPFILSKV
jgi:hypothetical protein